MENFMTVKACIFDFDGTIIDSEKYHYEAWKTVADTIGATFSYDEYMPFKSAGRKVVIPYLLNKVGIETTDETYQKYNELRQREILKTLEKLNENDIIPGFIAFVGKLKNLGIKCAVASSSAAAHVTAKRFKIFDLFDAFVDGEAKLKAKPDPEIFLHTASILNVNPENCVVFEDSINGLTAGKNAGMTVVGLQTYFTNIADFIIDDYTDEKLNELFIQRKKII